ncbi:DUF885 domain-containing protein [Brevundimonas sp. GCM10030266]|uniref:DUF885 domain-containing protein n=1 Tax=Brevundimonas sp. GCM10030266 TaxID=3273386 RepID=UPI00361CE401
MINRRRLLGSTAAGLGLLAMPAVARVAAPAQDSPARTAARGLYDRIFEGGLRASPMGATSLGLDTGENVALKSLLDSRAYADRLNTFKPMVEARSALAAVDATGLSGRDRSDYDTVVWMADRAAEIDAFPFGGVDSYGYPCPYVVSQLTGLYQAVPDFLDSQHTVETAADAEAYLARLNSFAEGMNHETARVAKDADEHGLIPPDFIIHKTLVQLRALRGQTGQGAPLVQSLVRKTAEAQVAGDWSGRAVALVDGPVAAALDAQIAQMESLLPRAVHDAGIGARPGGQAYYELCLRFQTSTGLSPREAHQVGLEQVAQIEALAGPLLRARGYTEGSVGARLTAFGKDPDYQYPNTDEGRAALLADLNRQVVAVEARLPEMFERLPRARVEVRRVPVELGSPRGYAQSPSLDGSRPGAYYINLIDTAIWPRWSLPTLTYHESLPGHHLQGALALEATDTPLLLKSMGFNAYGEGWGLYAEQLADELGMYDAFPEGRLGYHQSFLYRAARIVIDTGIHALGWSREQAIAYMIETVGLAPGAAESECERYCVWPGQACGYKIGHTEIDRLRMVAKERTGDRFDIKSFHSAVLDGGAMPLEVLGRVVDQWTAARLA